MLYPFPPTNLEDFMSLLPMVVLASNMAIINRNNFEFKGQAKILHYTFMNHILIYHTIQTGQGRARWLYRFNEPYLNISHYPN